MQDESGRLAGRRLPRACSGGSRESPEPSESVPPRFVFVRTRHGNSWRFRENLPPAAIRDLARLAAKEPPLAELEGAVGAPPPERLEAWRRVLAAAGEGAAADAIPERRFWALRAPGPAEIELPDAGEEALRVYQAGGVSFYLLADTSPRRVLERAGRLDLEPFAELWELGG